MEAGAGTVKAGSSADGAVARPGAVTGLRLLLLVPGWLMTVSLVLICVTTGSAPHSTEPVDLLAYSGPVGAVLGHLTGPRRRIVHGLVIAFQLALAALYLITARRDGADASGALAVLFLPVLGLALALSRRAWEFCWNGAAAAPRPECFRLHRAVVHPTADGGVRVDVGRRLQTQIVLGGTAAGFLGACAMIGVIEPGSAGTRVAVGLIGAPFLLAGLVCLLGALDGRRRRRTALTIDPHGIRWTGPDTAPLDVPWNAVAEVGISHAHAAANLNSGSADRVRLLIRPRRPDGSPATDPSGDPAVARIPLGDNPDFVPPMDAALHRLAPTVYTGIAHHQGVGFHLT